MFFSFCNYYNLLRYRPTYFFTTIYYLLTLLKVTTIYYVIKLKKFFTTIYYVTIFKTQFAHRWVHRKSIGPVPVSPLPRTRTPSKTKSKPNSKQTAAQTSAAAAYI